MNESMREIKCPKCDATATEVINAQENIRRGWYCSICHYFEKAILREIKVA